MSIEKAYVMLEELVEKLLDHGYIEIPQKLQEIKYELVDDLEDKFEEDLNAIWCKPRITKKMQDNVRRYQVSEYLNYLGKKKGFEDIVISLGADRFNLNYTINRGYYSELYAVPFLTLEALEDYLND